MKITTILFCVFSFFNSYTQTVIEMEEYNGVYKIECKINGIPMNFIFDTGASDVSISSTEASFLIKQGLITDEDIIGNINYKIANGKTLEGTKLNIKQIEIEGLILKNVTATIVHELNSPLLLGQSVLSRLGKITIDGNRLLIHEDDNLLVHDDNKNSDISAIEEMGTYSETVFGIENDFKAEIDYNSNTGKVTYKKFSDNLNIITISETSFYIDDIVKTSMEHGFLDQGNDLYVIWIKFETNGKKIEWKNTQYKKGEKYTAFTEKKYKDFMAVIANGNELPVAYLKKYHNHWMNFLGVKSSKEKIVK